MTFGVVGTASLAPFEGCGSPRCRFVFGLPATRWCVASGRAVLRAPAPALLVGIALALQLDHDHRLSLT